MQFSPEVLDQLAKALHETGYLRTDSDIEAVVRNVVAQATSSNPMKNGKGSFGSGGFSITRFIRGLTAMGGKVIASETRESDLQYAEKALLTGTTPGSYLVPTIQADAIIGLLTSAHVIRAAGCRVWPMPGIQKMNVPVESAAPNVVWGNSAGTGAGGQGVALTPSDPGLSQVAFDLKTAKALVAIPNELLATSVPAIDQIVSEILALAFAQAEMNVMVASTTATGTPPTVFTASGTTVINANGGSANGGAVKFTDLLAQIGQFYAQKGKGKPAWFMHPTVFYKDVMGIVDANGRPIVTGFDSLEGAFQGRLFGFPVYVSAEFPTNQAVGSGTNQSYIVFTNPQYLHIADRGSLELAVSFERYFDANETAVRGVHALDHAYAPAQAIVILQGVNV